MIYSAPSNSSLYAPSSCRGRGEAWSEYCSMGGLGSRRCLKVAKTSWRIGPVCEGPVTWVQRRVIFQEKDTLCVNPSSTSTKPLVLPQERPSTSSSFSISTDPILPSLPNGPINPC